MISGGPSFDKRERATIRIQMTQVLIRNYVYGFPFRILTAWRWRNAVLAEMLSPKLRIFRSLLLLLRRLASLNWSATSWRVFGSAL